MSASIGVVVTLALLALAVVLAGLAIHSAKSRANSNRLFLENLANTIDLRDPYTGGHSRRVAEFCTGILTEMGIRGEQAKLIISAARVHDIGKIGLPDSVLKKEGSLSYEEMQLIQTHAQKGADLLHSFSQFSRTAVIVLHHHERWDGKGYPSGIKGEEIPLGARVIAVADSFDAMTSDRPYRRAMTRYEALALLKQGKNTQWEARIVDAFARSLVKQQPSQGNKEDAPVQLYPQHDEMRIAK